MSARQRHIIGVGRLTWDANERRTDRYGAVYLMRDGDSTWRKTPPLTPLSIPLSLAGSRVRLIAKVIEARESTHIGDLFHGVFPRKPKVGDLIELGDGLISLGKNCEGSDTVVLTPVPFRERFWMSIRGLYDAHEQTVELIAEGPGEGVQ